LVQSLRGGDHPRVGLGEGGDLDSALLKLGRKLIGAPRIERQLSDRVAPGKLLDYIPGAEDRFVAVVDPAPDMPRWR
jgi:hypothetical protein